MSRLASPKHGRVRCISWNNTLLGEGPCWNPGNSSLTWVDIKKPALFKWISEVVTPVRWSMPYEIGCAYPTDDDRFVIGDSAGLAFYNSRTQIRTSIAGTEPKGPTNRYNDGKIDRLGRLWAGTLNDANFASVGTLYRLDQDLSIHVMATGIGCSNGIGWSPDDRKMYFVDSQARTISAYDFDLEPGTISRRRTIAQFGTNDGSPDGLTVDSEGYLWVAMWDGWRMVRLDPEGFIDCEIPMPVQRPTSCTFGGPHLRTLFITSASFELGEGALANGGLAGSLFALDCDVAGIAERPFQTRPRTRPETSFHE